MIAIHSRIFGFRPRWVDYCKKQNIPYKLVNCYSNDLIEQLQGCEALMWHFNHNNHKDNITAKQILFALEHTGFIVFPDFRTAWHFDDKVAQKYLFEKIAAPLVPSYVFFDKKEALEWLEKTNMPKVFKLRGGAGSQNVELVKSFKAGKKIILQAFGKGFKKYSAWVSLKERFKKYKLGIVSFNEVLKGFIRLFYSPSFSKHGGREVGYVYFQVYIPNNDSDICIVIIDGKAFGLKRYERENDFRASGSGKFKFEKELIDRNALKISFDISNRLSLQVGVFDYVYNNEKQPLLVEMSYGYAHKAYDECPGYWDETSMIRLTQTRMKMPSCEFHPTY
jgi:glutathione synthase/RimK-type ligase-like ATP-grasp enzyme